jgi:Domain of unknown function (DUF4178)
MEVSCPNCNTVTKLEIGFKVENFVCPSCKSLYKFDKEGLLQAERQFNRNIPHVGLLVGQEGIIKGTAYTVTGILTKKAYGSYYWAEYMLYDNTGKVIYLSESSGHWILLHEIEDAYDVKNHPRFLMYDDMRFNLYEYSDPEIASAQGFFDFEIPKKTVHMVEYINPPYIVSIEEMNGVETTFYGEHLSKSDVKKAFSRPYPQAYIPERSGVGIVQPFLINLWDTAIVFCVVSLLIFCSHWLIYSNQSEKTVFSKKLTFDQYNNKDVVSSSFVLEGGSAPLSIKVFSAVDNSWANIQVALIDEKNGDEVYANKDVEHYHGYTDGESWSEGNTSEDFNICGVSAGKYHLVITPQKAPEDYQNNIMIVSAVWNEPSSRNIWMTILFMFLIMVALYFLSNNFEKKRWADSNYSPYDYE